MRRKSNSGRHFHGLVRFILEVARQFDIYIRSAWGDDDDKNDPEHHRKTAKELADAVVHFEHDIARASLDLCVFNPYVSLGIA